MPVGVGHLDDVRTCRLADERSTAGATLDDCLRRYHDIDTCGQDNTFRSKNEIDNRLETYKLSLSISIYQYYITAFNCLLTYFFFFLYFVI